MLMSIVYVLCVFSISTDSSVFSFLIISCLHLNHWYVCVFCLLLLFVCFVLSVYILVFGFTVSRYVVMLMFRNLLLWLFMLLHTFHLHRSYCERAEYSLTYLSFASFNTPYNLERHNVWKKTTTTQSLILHLIIQCTLWSEKYSINFMHMTLSWAWSNCRQNIC